MSDEDVRTDIDDAAPEDTEVIELGTETAVDTPTVEYEGKIDPAGDRLFWEAPTPPAAPLPTRAGRAGTSGMALFLAALLGAGLGSAASYVALDGGASGVSPVRVAPPVERGTLPGSEDAAATVAAAVLPSIVEVDVAGRFGGSGLGSGVIYTTDGFILTNDHVIAGAEEIVVTLADGTELAAALVGTAGDIGIDVAVLKVVADEPLNSATFGASKDLRVGELAVAIGSPFGLQATVTSGIISALHRNDPLGQGVQIPDAIQTDAAINQGNSGGALANSRGEVIGINTAIIGGTTGGNIGLGFAIPIDVVRTVADQLIADGRAELAFLGIEGVSLPGGEGARVVGVQAGTAADDAGLREGDVITALDGEAIPSFDALISLLLSRSVGDKVNLTVIRNGTERTISATLGARTG